MSIRSWRVAIPKDFSCQWILGKNALRLSGCIPPILCGSRWHDRETDAKDFEKNGWSGIGKTEGPRWNPIGSSMSIRSWRVAIPKDFSCQWIPRQNLRAEADRLHPSYTLWVEMDMTEGHDREIDAGFREKWMVWDRENGRTTVESYWILDVNQMVNYSAGNVGKAGGSF
jgi:hypothetical protein